MKYSDQLKHPDWQRKRLEILQRDNFTCQSCRDTETTLHVHHLTYIKGRKPWEYEGDNFLTLCDLCHTIIPNFESTGNQFLDCVTSKVFSIKYRAYKFKNKASDLDIILIANPEENTFVLFDVNQIKCLING